METFVVRVWRASGPDVGDASGFQGMVEHPSSRQRIPFTSERELLDFIGKGLAQLTMAPNVGSGVADDQWLQ